MNTTEYLEYTNKKSLKFPETILWNSAGQNASTWTITQTHFTHIQFGEKEYQSRSPNYVCWDVSKSIQRSDYADLI